MSGGILHAVANIFKPVSTPADAVYSLSMLVLAVCLAIFGVVLLMLLPFFSGTGEKSARRRPAAVLTVIVLFLSLVTVARLGTYAPWSPHMDAWTADALPVEYLKGRTPLERRGAILVQSKQCRNCHALGEGDGLRGPALDGVATRLTRDQLIRQVIQGGGNMPAYGKNLSPAEVTALVAFMQTLKR